MIPMNASEADYERFCIFGHDTLFTNMRIDRDTLPEGLYAYDLRNACDGDPCELKSIVVVNHWGTVIVKNPIENADAGIPIGFDDYNYIGDKMTLDEFMSISHEIKEITAAELRSMNDSEGLILQGCCGDINEWIDGINKELTGSGILKNGARLDDVCKFTNDGLTCLLFKFSEGTDIDIGKLAIWRIQTHEALGGTWLSDYVPNKLGGFERELTHEAPTMNM